MKPSISLETGGHSLPASTPPLFSSSASQHSISTEMAKTKEVTSALLDTEFPLFEEATQTAARFLGIPICFVGITGHDVLVLKAAIGLSQLGLMNPLARTRRLALGDSLVKSVLATKRSLILPHISDRDSHAQSALVREYGIQSYLGIPLLTSDGTCLGVLAAMDIQARDFSAEAIAFMELLARWSVSEYERQQLSEVLAAPRSMSQVPSSNTSSGESSLLDMVRLTLMSQLTQDMRNPLTTITGMANMLSREIYGTLTPKQREYADIVRSSSQYLLEIANEVLELSSLDARIQPLNPTSVDINMVGQQVQRMLSPFAKTKSQEIRLTVEPGSRLWTLDRDVVRQLLYHLLYSIIQASGEGGTLRVHCVERDSSLNVNIWLTHPWLGEGLPGAITLLYQRLNDANYEAELLEMLLVQATGRGQMLDQVATPITESQQHPEGLPTRETLSLLLSKELIERHDGTLTLQGSVESGYRFIIALPFLGAPTVA